MQRRKSYLPGFILYILVIFFIIFDFQFEDYIQREPQSIHHWRQSDGASIALNYYHYGMEFFKPETHFQCADVNTSGYGVGEFPIVYYASAALYKLFGPKTYIIRVLHVLIFLIGLFHLYKGLRERYKDRFWALFIPIMLSASPVILYYATNYLPDTAALGLVLIAWYHISNYDLHKRTNDIWKIAFFFCLAGLLKITALLSFIPIFGLAILSLFPISKWKFFHHPIKASLAFLAVLIVNLGWYKWAIAYNALHRTPYFSTHTWPYNSLDEETIANVWDKIINKWGPDYFYPDTYVFFILLILIFLWNVRRMKAFWNYMMGSLLIGTIVFGYLFFLNLMNHDYYTINLYIFPVLLMVALVDLFHKKKIRFAPSWLIKILLTVFAYYNIEYGNEILQERYTGWVNDMRIYQKMDGIKPYLKSLGISREDRFLIVGDPTPNTALYRIDQKGWTDLLMHSHKDDMLQELFGKGFSYMVILNEAALEERPFLKKYTTKTIGEFNGLAIYDVRR